MTLNLDTRQRAMLAEMGVRVWLPQSLEPVELAQVEVASQEASASPAPQPVRSQTAAQALEPVLAQFQALEGVAEMDWGVAAWATAWGQGCWHQPISPPQPPLGGTGGASTTGRADRDSDRLGSETRIDSDLYPSRPAASTTGRAAGPPTPCGCPPPHCARARARVCVCVCVCLL